MPHEVESAFEMVVLSLQFDIYRLWSECRRAMKTNNTRKIATTQMRMLRWILGVWRLEHTRNEEIRRLLNLPPIDEIMRSGRLQWSGHVQRREENNVACRVMNLALPGIRRRGRPRKTWKQRTREDTKEIGVTVNMLMDRMDWKRRARRRTRPTLVDWEKGLQGEQGEHTVTLI